MGVTVCEAGPFEALGYVFSVVCSPSSVREHLAELFGAMHVPDAFGAHRYEIRTTRGGAEFCVDGSFVASAKTCEELVPSVVHELNRNAIESTEHLVLHAGGVEFDGAGIALPGVMEAGKTTLTAGLVCAGFRYLTDEAVAIDRQTLMVHAYPKPLSIDRGAWSLFPDLEPCADLASDAYKAAQWQVPPTAIRRDALGLACSLRLIVFPRYEPGVKTELQAMSRGSALVELATNTFRFNEQGPEALELLAAVTRGATCYRLPMSDLDEAVSSIATLAGLAEK